MVHKNTPQPRYRELAAELMDEIDSGKLSLGDRLPGELEMVSRYQVSRFTVREALRILENRGFISRQRGKGTVVTSHLPSQNYRQRIKSFDEMLQFPSDTKRELISSEEVECEGQVADWMDCEASGKCMKYSLVRFRASDDVPLCWQDIYLQAPMKKYGRWLNAGHGPADPNIFKEIDSDIENVQIDLCAGRVQAHMAEALKVERGTPTLCVVRRFIDQGGKAMSVSLSEYPEGRYTFSLEFTREWRRD